MVSVAVIKVAVGVKRAELVSLHQDDDKPLRKVAKFVRSKAETCNFNTFSKCKCGKKNFTSYTKEAIKDVMVAGIGDEDIRTEVFSIEDILSRSSFEIIYFIESTEMDRHAIENSQNVSGVSLL